MIGAFVFGSTRWIIKIPAALRDPGNALAVFADVADGQAQNPALLEHAPTA